MVLDGGDEVDCTTCGGYEAGDADAGEVASEPVVEEPPFEADPPAEEAPAPEPAKPAATPKAATVSAVKPTPAPAAQKAPAAAAPKSEEQKTTKATPVMPAQTTVPNFGEVREIKAESGISLEIKGTWYKFSYSETRIVTPDCNLDEAKQDLWDTVNNEVDTQVAAAVSLVAGNKG